MGCLTRSQWLNNKSRMMGDHHVRIYENLELKCSGLLDNCFRRVYNVFQGVYTLFIKIV
jgi:hypothetical protein